MADTIKKYKYLTLESLPSEVVIFRLTYLHEFSRYLQGRSIVTVYKSADDYNEVVNANLEYLESVNPSIEI